MSVDTRRCVRCSTCVPACKAENNVPEVGFRDWIVTETRCVFPYLRQEIRWERCNHCEHPPSVSACPTGARHVAEGGIVLVARDKCTGCKACIAACPYDARYMHPAGSVDKCTFGIHRVREGRPPACVEICPTKASPSETGPIRRAKSTSFCDRDPLRCLSRNAVWNQTCISWFSALSTWKGGRWPELSVGQASCPRKAAEAAAPH